MAKKAYRVLAIVFAVISLIGLVSFLGGIRQVNPGAFLFPLAAAIVFWVLYKRKDAKK